jgi:hypothetical protein
MTTLPGLVIGFPPVRRGAWERDTHGALQYGIATPIGITVSPDAPSRSTKLAVRQLVPP